MQRPAETERPFSLEEFLKVLARRRRAIQLALLLSSLLATFVTLSIPNVYEAVATVVVEPGKVPERYLSPAIAPTAQQLFDVHRKVVHGNETLRPLIQRHELYAEGWLMRQIKSSGILRAIFEKMIRTPEDEMRSDLTLAWRGGQNQQPYIEVSYRGREAQAAANVANEVTSVLVDAHAKARQRHVEDVVAFLKAERATAEDAFRAQEGRLIAFKQANIEVLPEREALLVASSVRLQAQVDEFDRAIQAAESRVGRIVVEIGAAERDASAAAGASTEAAPLRELERKLGAAQQHVAALAERAGTLAARYKPRHPDIVQTRAELEGARAALRSLEKEYAAKLAASGDGAAAPTATAGARAGPDVPSRGGEGPPARRIEDARIERRELTERLDGLRQQKAQVSAALLESSVLLARLPQVRRELEVISGEYVLQKSRFDFLLSQIRNAETASAVERARSGERLAVMQAAEPPPTPFWPNRVKVLVLGLSLSIGAALALGFFREMRDHSYKSAEDYLSDAPAPLLVAVPRLAAPRLPFDIGRALGARARALRRDRAAREPGRDEPKGAPRGEPKGEPETAGPAGAAEAAGEEPDER